MDLVSKYYQKPGFDANENEANRRFVEMVNESDTVEFTIDYILFSDSVTSPTKSNLLDDEQFSLRCEVSTDSYAQLANLSDNIVRIIEEAEGKFQEMVCTVLRIDSQDVRSTIHSGATPSDTSIYLNEEADQDNNQYLTKRRQLPRSESLNLSC